MHSPTTYPARRVWLWLTTLLIALGSGHFYASDEETMFGVTVRMWHAIQHLFGVHVVVDRPILTPYGPMQSLLALFTLPIGTFLAWLGPTEMSTWLIRLPSTWINALMVASIATLLGWISVQRGHSSRVAIWVALSYAVATPALKYAGSFFSEPTASWWLLLVALPALVSTPLRTRTYVICGLASLAAILTKVAVAPTLALIGIVVVAGALFDRDWRKLIAWSSGAVIAGISFLSYNLLARGDLLSSGYNSRQQGYAVDWGMITTGIHGQFLSSGKSIFVYAPVLLLLPIGIWCMRRQWRTLGLIGVAVAGIVVVHTNVIFWHGDGAWGPRYVMLCLPFMLIPLADAYTWLGTQSLALRRTIMGVLLVLTLWVQIAALTINFNAYIINTRDERTRYYTPSASPIVGQWRILWAQLSSDLAQWYAPNVTLSGWTYSEGDRARGEQFPRFARPGAQFAIIPRGQDWPMLHADYHTCFDPSGQLLVDVALNDTVMTAPQACPPRIIHLLLPRAYSTVRWQSTGVTVPGLPQHEWYATLAATVRTLQVGDVQGTYPIAAGLTPPSRMPTGANAMRIWASDIRSGFYDFWWYYLIAIPASQSAWPVVGCIVLILLMLSLLAWRTPTNSPPPVPTPTTPTPPSTPPTT